jgi:hypothetical protein
MAITLYGFDGSTYVRTVRAGEVFEVKGFTPWWERMQALPSYESTAPQLGAVGLWVKLGDYSVVGRENYSGSLQPHDYVKSRLKLIDDQGRTRWQSRDRAKVCDRLGGHGKTTVHFDPNAVRDAA